MWKTVCQSAYRTHHSQRQTLNGMLPTDRLPIHPGIILLEELLEPMDISEETLANHLNISVKQNN